MNQKEDYMLPGQMSIFECFSHDLWSGKMSPEPSAQTVAKTSEPSSKKRQGSSVKMPLFLDLREGGQQAAALWETGGPLPGVYTMRSFGECPSEERESRLSQILEVNPLPKYSLSAKACQGILRRAQKRGKKLPELLEKTLIRQSACKETELTEQTPQDATDADGEGGVLHTQHNRQTCRPRQSVSRNEPGNRGGGKGILIQNERTGALSTLNNQSVLAAETHIENGGGVEHEAVSVGNGQMCNITMQPIANSLDCMHDQQAVITYGLDRASFNQGQNAQYDFSVIEEQAQTLVSRGPGGGNDGTVGALCARDFKGVGSQYVDEGKCVVQDISQN